MSKPKLVVFASGTKDGGGSGFEQLVLNTQTGLLDAKIVGVVSNQARGGIKRIAERHRVPFSYFSWPPYGDAAMAYRHQVIALGAEWVALSGWLKPISGLNPIFTFNIHPGPLPRFGGQGMFGHHVHEAVIAAYRRDEVTHSAVTMHFVTQGGADEYDRGLKFFEYPVAITADDTDETLAARVNEYEHGWQSWVTNLVVHGEISWDGSGSVVVPDWYAQQPYCPAELRDCELAVSL